MPLVPLKYRVLIKPEIVEEKTAGGIYLPEQVVKNEKMQTQKGEIVALGAEAEVGDVEIGDKVLYAKYGGKFIKEDPNSSEEYVLVNDEDVLVKIRS